jgi:prepilin-type N-terminal cleavage/methylation domain-containing protein
MRKKFSGFTLVEMIIATGIFAVIVVSTGSLLFMVQRISMQQRQNLELNENLRWGQTYIIKEAQQCSNFTLLSSLGLDGFNCTLNGNVTWYWRGNSTYGNNTIIYHAVNATFAEANSTKQELIGSVTNNTANGALFSVSSGLLYANLTLCPYSDRPIGKGNQVFKCRLAIRTRN